jgi:hypothetical protein
VIPLILLSGRIAQSNTRLIPLRRARAASGKPFLRSRSTATACGVSAESGASANVRDDPGSHGSKFKVHETSEIDGRPGRGVRFAEEADVGRAVLV